MANEAVAERGSPSQGEQRDVERTQVDEGADPGHESGGAGEREGSEQQSESPRAGVARDMAVGAFVGAMAGAAWRVARTLQPERLDAVKANVTEVGKEIGAAAGGAVREVLASRPINELISARGDDGKRAEIAKSMLSDAVAAAGDAAKGVLESKGAGSSSQREE